MQLADLLSSTLDLKGRHYIDPKVVFDLVFRRKESECGSLDDMDVASMIIVDERNGRTFNGALEHRGSSDNNNGKFVMGFIY